MNNKNIDAIDKKILKLLMKNARMSYAEIGREVHLSRVAVRDRIRRMEEEGIITRYSAIVSRFALKMNLAVFLEIEVIPSKIDYVASEIAKMDEVAIVYQMTGPTVLHIHIFIENEEKLSEFLNNKVYPLEGIIKVTTYMLLKEYKTNLSIK